MGAIPNNRALRSVREQRGLELLDVAEFANISPDRLTEFERGAREPSRKQMERLARAYGVPLYAFFGQGIPNLPSVPQDFRKSDPEPAAISPRGMRALLATEQQSVFAKQLAIEVGFEPVELNSAARQKKSPKDRATALRQAFDEWRLGRAASLDFTGPEEQQFMAGLRLFFEIQGGVVNVNDAPSQDYLGFFQEPDGGFPSIFVNRSISSRKAQLFTLAHEYSHWLLGMEGISNPFRPKNAVERLCNQFAAEFLAPMDKFVTLVEQFPRSTRSDVTDLINAAAQRTLLSKHAAAIRLIEGGYVTQTDFRKWRRIFEANPRAEKDDEKETSIGGGGAPHAKRLSELGHLSVYLSDTALKQKLIDRFDVVEKLGLSLTLQDRAFALASKRLEIALK